MTERAYIQDRQDETDRYASREGFCRIFAVPEVREARTGALKELEASPHMDRPQNQIFRAGEEVK